ncbi:MAG: GNAT family N-acetyltransferase [Acidimicrobiia bacterium]
MAGYPHEFEFDVLLKDGRVVHIRPIRPDDAQLEHDFILRVGPQSMYQRFFRAKKDLSPEELRYFTTIDYDDRMALIALSGEQMVAVGRYDVTAGKMRDGGRVAEVAFLVEDAYQGHGIASLLLQHLTVYGRLRGVKEFEAFVLADNFGMMRLFRSSGYQVQRSLDEDVYRVEFPTDYSPEARSADWEHERRSVTASLTPLFFPRKVAVIGADQDPTVPGGRLLRNLVFGSYTGIAYPVNPDRGFVHSIKSYPSIESVPDEIDLAFISLPPEETIEAIAAAGRKGVRVAVVTSWTTDASAAWEDRLLRSARRVGMRMLGPDSAGIVVTSPEVSFHGHTGKASVPGGRVGLATQSGALGTAMLSDAARLSCGLSSFVSLGDAGDITANDLLIYWEGDPFTSVIALYVETFGNARRFGRLARRVGRTKPIVAVKGGRSAVDHGGDGRRQAAVEALFRASGVIRAETMTEMFDIVALLSRQPLPLGRRVAVIAEAPGPASLTAGALEANGLEVPAKLTLAGAEVDNPILATADRHQKLVDEIAAAAAVDAVVVVDIPSVGFDAAVTRTGDTIPVLSVRMGDPLQGGSTPEYGYPEPAARALASAVRYSEWRSRPEGEVPEFPDVERAEAAALVNRAFGRLGESGGSLDPSEVTQLLTFYRIPTEGPAGGVAGAVSMTEDPLFGPLIVFRMSGRLAELAGDQSFRINPLHDLDAIEMISEVRSAALIGEGTGRHALAELILRVSLLVEHIPEITELILDPVTLIDGQAYVASASITARPLAGAFSPSRKDVPGRML